MRTAYHLLLVVHVVCVVGGFGGLLYNGLILDLARRRSDVAAAGVLAVNGQVAQFGELLVYGVLLSGIGVVVASQHRVSFSQAWIIAAFALFVGMVGLRHGLIRPAERRFRASLLELVEAPPVAPPQRPPQMDELDRLQRRIGAGWGLFNVALLASLVVMVFKP